MDDAINATSLPFPRIEDEKMMDCVNCKRREVRRTNLKTKTMKDNYQVFPLTQLEKKKFPSNFVIFYT